MLRKVNVTGLGVYGVFLAEPVSNVLGGAACYCTMLTIMLPELETAGKYEITCGFTQIPQVFLF